MVSYKTPAAAPAAVVAPAVLVDTEFDDVLAVLLPPPPPPQAINIAKNMPSSINIANFLFVFI